jgi:hypothetical protein
MQDIKVSNVDIKTQVIFCLQKEQSVSTYKTCSKPLVDLKKVDLNTYPVKNTSKY